MDPGLADGRRGKGGRRLDRGWGSMARFMAGLGRCSQNCHKPQAMPGATLEARKYILCPPYGKRIMRPSGNSIQHSSK